MLKPLAAAAIMVISASLSAQAAVIYDQPPQSPVVSTRASQNIGGSFTFQTFDNFTLTADTAVTDVHWQGSYFNTLAPGVPTANSVGFGVNFYADNGSGAPGTLITGTTFIGAGAANETFVGTQPFSTFTLAIYDYEVDIPAFNATAGTQYWLSVYALSPSPSPTEAQWGWNGGLPGDGTSVQNGSVVLNDRAFALTNDAAVAVPEPGSLGLLAGALLLLLGKRRSAARRDQSRIA